MPNIPDFANIIVFFGGDSLPHLETMLKYYRQILDKEAWQKFLFILAAPGDNQSVAHLSRDIPQSIRERCCDGSGDAHTFIYQQTAERIHRMYQNGRLNLHIICDDFLTARFPAEAPSSFVDILRSALPGINIYSYYYLMLHHQDKAAIERQRSLAEKLVEDEKKDSRLYPYMLSLEQDDHSLTTTNQIWSALRSEIFIISHGNRLVESGKVNSLGYTSLNADEKELENLRRQYLAEQMERICNEPYSAELALQDLKINAASPNTISMHEISAWLRDIIVQDRRRATRPSIESKQFSNLRVLSEVDHARIRNRDVYLEAHYKLLREFYKINLDSKRPVTCAREYMNGILGRLIQHQNLCNFPLSVLEQIGDHLSALTRSKQTHSLDPNYPKLVPTDYLHINDYILRCCNANETAAQNESIELDIPRYAEAFKKIFCSLSGLIKSAASISSLIRQLEPIDARSLQLRDKYPQYFADIQYAANQLPRVLFSSSILYDNKTLAASKSRMDEAMHLADRAILEKMSPGFRTSFIRAIECEFSLPGAMDEFLGRYLNNQHRMFCNEVVPMGTPIVTYFSNPQLRNTAWAAVHQESTFFVQIDNVERLDYFVLADGVKYNTLVDYISSENAEDPYNLYFRSTQNSVALPTLPSRPFALPQDTEQAASRPEVLTYEQDKLTWKWTDDIDIYQVFINGEPFTIDRNTYHRNNGMPIRVQLREGNNHITLTDPRHPDIILARINQPFAPLYRPRLRYENGFLRWDSQPGVTQYRIQINNSNFVTPHGTAISRAELDTMGATDDKAVHQATLYDPNGQQLDQCKFCFNPEAIRFSKSPVLAVRIGPAASSYCLRIQETIEGTNIFYPLKSDAEPDRDGLVRYRGLSFSGSWTLISDPNDMRYKTLETRDP